MRRRGVRVDLDRAEQVGKELKNKEDKILSQIKNWYGITPDLWAAAASAHPNRPFTHTFSVDQCAASRAWLNRHLAGDRVFACVDPQAP